MPRPIAPAILLALLIVLQAQLWLGRGSIPNVAELIKQLEYQKDSNLESALANDQLSAEINDLKEGLEMVEEKARSELGMLKMNEIYVQIAK